jgi:uncharacterized protein YndB with AHSA1/START domain
MTKEIIGAQSSDLILIIDRTFDAPRELVFEAFTDPQHLIKWWGPKGCAILTCETDPRPGGVWSISMRTPKMLPQFAHRYPVETSGDGQSIVEKQRGVYQEVRKPERLTFTYAFEDGTGQPSHKMVVTLTFADQDGRTRLTLHQAVFESIQARDDHARGWTEALGSLAEYLTRSHPR